MHHMHRIASYGWGLLHVWVCSECPRTVIELRLVVVSYYDPIIPGFRDCVAGEARPNPVDDSTLKPWKEFLDGIDTDSMG